LSVLESKKKKKKKPRNPSDSNAPIFPAGLLPLPTLLLPHLGIAENTSEINLHRLDVNMFTFSTSSKFIRKDLERICYVIKCEDIISPGYLHFQFAYYIEIQINLQIKAI
jgi:hypothetical protein